MDVLELSGGLLPSGATAVHFAAKRRNAQALRQLLEAFVDDIDATDELGRTPLQVALLNGMAEAVKVLLEHGADMNAGTKPTCAEMLQLPQYSDFVTRLVIAGVRLPFKLGPWLPEMAYGGDVGTLSKFLQQDGVNVNTQDHLGRTALHYACHTGHLSSVALLLKYGGDQSSPDSSNSLPLHLACSSGHLHIVVALIDSCQDQSLLPSLLNSQDVLGRTPLHVSLYSKNFEVTKHLLHIHKEEVSLDISLQDSNGHSVLGLLFSIRCIVGSMPPTLLPCLSTEEANWLLHNAISDRNMEVVHFALSEGADVECFDFMQQNSLLLCTKLSFLDGCQALVLQHGADVNVCDFSGANPLYCAAKTGCAEVFSFLLSCKDIDPVPFYSKFADPLPLQLQVILLDFFIHNPSAPKPKNWVRWLALFAPLATGDTFKKFIELACPYNWATALLDYSALACESRGHFKRKHRSLSIYQPGSSYVRKINIGKVPRRLKMACRAHCKEAERKASFIHLPLPRKRPNAFDFHSNLQASKQYYPIHAAVLQRNDAVLKLVISEVRDDGNRLQQFLSMKDGTGHTLLELIAERRECFADTLCSFQLNDYLEQELSKLFHLPDGVSFKEALLHYLVVNGNPSYRAISPSGKVKEIGTPLEQWPHWYLSLAASSHCRRELGIEFSLDHPPDRYRLAKELLVREPFDLYKDVGSYPSFLYAAVTARQLWAVDLLIHDGACPTASFNNRYALCDAMKSCQLEAVSFFLQKSFEPFSDLVGQPECTFLVSFVQSLIALAGACCLDVVLDILDILHEFPAFDKFWFTNNAPRLLYVSREIDHSGSIEKKCIGFICSFLVSEWDASFEKPFFNFLQHLQTYSNINCLQSQPLKKLVSFCLAEFQYPMLICHHICGRGYIDIMKLILENADVNMLLNKLDSAGRSPLFYAALGGHLTVVQLLLDKASTAFSQLSQLPLVGALLYLDLAPRALLSCQKSHHVMSVKRNCAYGTLLDLPQCSFSDLFTKCSAVKQLIELLMPYSNVDLYSPLTRNGTLLLDPFLLIADIQNLILVEPLLQRYAECPLHLSQTQCSVNDDSGSTLDRAIELCPVYKETLAHSAFEDILVQLHRIQNTPFQSVLTAAGKGYWKLVMKTTQYPFAASVTTATLKSLSSLAIKHNCLEAAKHLLMVLQRRVSCTCDELRLSVRHNRVSLVRALASASFTHMHESSLLAVEYAAKLGNKTVVDVLLRLHLNSYSQFYRFSDVVLNVTKRAAKAGREDVLGVVFHTRSSLEPDLFWFTVLVYASIGGHESVALKAISKLSVVYLESVHSQPDYCKVLKWACFWGMDSLLTAIPFTKSDLFSTEGDEVSPIECAFANGHVGKLSRVFGFPSDLDQTDSHKLRHLVDPSSTLDTVQALMVGSFHKVCSYNYPQESRSCNVLSTQTLCLQSILYRACSLGIASVVKACIEHLGDCASRFVQMNSGLLFASFRHLNVLKALLSCMTEDDLDSCLSTLDSVGNTLAAKTALEGCSECTNYLLQQLPESLHFVNKSNGNSLLHLAVRNGSLETVSCILDNLGKCAAGACLAKNHHSLSPFLMALSMGHVDIAVVMCRYVSTEESDWKDDALKVNGWFRKLMKPGIGALTFQSSVFNLKIRETCTHVCLFSQSVQHGHSLVTQSLLEASLGLLVKRCDSCNCLLNDAVVNFLSSFDSFDFSQFQKVDITSAARQMVYNKNSATIVPLLDLFHSKGTILQIDASELFIMSCRSGCSDLVEHFLAKKVLSFESLQSAFTSAVSWGHFNIASRILMETNLQIDTKKIGEENTYLPALYKEIFYTDSSYYMLLENFFDSLVHNERLTLSSVWLMHVWTSSECKLMKERFGYSGGVPTNPWSVTLLGSSESSVPLYIDWDSFANTLSSVSSNVPLFVEAAVFSPAVLGQLMVPSVHCSLNLVDLSACIPMNQNIRSLTLSSTSWPNKESAVFTADGSVTLILSYHQRAFIFPSTEVTRVSAPLIQASEQQEYYPENQLAAKYRSEIAELLRIPVSVGVSVNSAMSTDSMLPLLDGVLKDIHGSFVLCTEYGYHYLQFMNTCGKQNRCPDLSKLYNCVQISIAIIPVTSDCADTENVEVHCTNNQLEVSFNVSVETLKRCCDVFLYMLAEQLLEAEFSFAVCKFQAYVSTLMVACLKGTTTSLQCLSSKDVGVHTQGRSDLFYSLDNYNQSLWSLPYLKNFQSVKQLVLIFVDAVRAISLYYPTAFGDLSESLQSGICIVISSTETTRVDASSKSTLCLFLNTADMQVNDKKLELLSVFQSLCDMATEKKSSFTSVVPAPFCCHVIWERSMGLLFPKCGVKGCIELQLVDYFNNPVKGNSTSGTACNIIVSISSPSGRKYKSVHSEMQVEDEHSSAGSVFIAPLKGGIFSIQWTPSEVGIHSISITMIGISIKNFPLRSVVLSDTAPPSIEMLRRHVPSKCLWSSLVPPCELSSMTPGSRNTSAGCPFTFVVAHMPPECRHCVPAILINRSKYQSLRGFPAADPESAINNAASGKPLHFISICSLQGRVGSWRHVACGPIQLLICPEDNSQSCSFESCCFSLGGRCYFVVLRTTKACRFKMFAACATCQAVMEVLWADGPAHAPKPCYVVPGPLSPKHCKLRHSLQRRGKDLGPLFAGSHVNLLLKAVDKYGNAHTSGGAGIAVDVSPVHANESNPAWEREVANIQRSTAVTDCCVEYKGKGLYRVDFDIYRKGMWSVGVGTCGCAYYHILQQLMVESSDPFAPNCRLDPTNTYRGVVSQRMKCSLFVLDQYGNMCSKIHPGVKAFFNGIPIPIVKESDQTFSVSFTLYHEGTQQLLVTVLGEAIPACPVDIAVHRSTSMFHMVFKHLREVLQERYSVGYTPTITINRSCILESALHSIPNHHFYRCIRVRFDDEPGIDTGGVAREFFHLFFQDFVNPHYALFQYANGFYKPNPSSLVNPEHLIYFNFFGKMLAKAICDGHQTSVRFTPSVYKYILQKKVVLDDLRVEDINMYMCLVDILKSESEEEVNHLAMTFTTSRVHFDCLETVELVKGGSDKAVTLANKEEFVHSFCRWYLIGCVGEQLESVRKGFNFLISSSVMEMFSPHELELMLSGWSTIDVATLRMKTELVGYTWDSQEIAWLFEVLESFSQEQRRLFLQFTTGSPSFPCGEEQTPWKLKIMKSTPTAGNQMLPTASTCFTSLRLPVYPSRVVLREKLLMAITDGQCSFLMH